MRLSEKVHITAQKQLPLMIHMNTTFGELLADNRTADYVKRFKTQLEETFGASSSDNKKDDGDVAISDAMNTAMITCMPLRNVVSYGMCGKKELLDMIEEMNGQ